MNPTDIKLPLCHIHNTQTHTPHDSSTTSPQVFLKRCCPKIFNSARWSLTREKSRESLNPQRAQIKTLTEKKIFFLFLPKSLSNGWQINKSELKKGINYGERKVRLGTHKHRLLLLLRFELKYNIKCIIWNRRRCSNDYLAAKSWATVAAAARSLWLPGMNFPQFLAKTVVFSCSSSSSRTYPFLSMSTIYQQRGSGENAPPSPPRPQCWKLAWKWPSRSC